MRKYVIATHGKMAEGIQSTLDIIVGPRENLTFINAYTDECADPMPEFQRIMEENPNDDIVIMTDMLGGSVNNNAVVLTENKRVHVVTGINLALVISLVMSDEDADTREVIRQAVNSSKEMIIYCNELSKDNEAEEDDF